MASPEHPSIAPTTEREAVKAKPGFWERRKKMSFLEQVGETTRNIALVIAVVNGIVNANVVLNWAIKAANAAINQTSLTSLLLLAGAGEATRRIGKALKKEKNHH